MYCPLASKTLSASSPPMVDTLAGGIIGPLLFGAIVAGVSTITTYHRSSTIASKAALLISNLVASKSLVTILPLLSNSNWHQQLRQRVKSPNCWSAHALLHILQSPDDDDPRRQFSRMDVCRRLRGVFSVCRLGCRGFLFPSRLAA